MSPNRPWKNTDYVETGRRRPPGGRFSIRTLGIWYRLTLQSFQQLPFECCSFLSFWPTIDGRIVHFNVTEQPTAQWVAQQLVETFPFDSARCYSIRDRDSIYGQRVLRRIKSLGAEEVVATPASPWPNAYVERMISNLRRELLDPVINLNERHLKPCLSSYLDYHHPWRTHRALGQDASDGRAV